MPTRSRSAPQRLARRLSATVQDAVRLGLRERAGTGFGRRRIYLPRGRTLGGSSALNAMIYIRGNKADLTAGLAVARRGWSYREMLPYFIRSESNERGDPKYYGHSGPLCVQDSRSMPKMWSRGAEPPSGWRAHTDKSTSRLTTSSKLCRRSCKKERV